MRTDLESFTRQLVNHIVDSLKDAIKNPEWRVTAIEDAKVGWDLLNRRLARPDVPDELQVLCARLALLFRFVGFPTCETFDPARIEENKRVEAELKGLIEEIEKIDLSDRS